MLFTIRAIFVLETASTAEMKFYVGRLTLRPSFRMIVNVEKDILSYKKILQDEKIAKKSGQAYSEDHPDDVIWHPFYLGRVLSGAPRPYTISQWI